jgi:hypothetical protein
MENFSTYFSSPESSNTREWGFGGLVNLHPVIMGAV